MFEYFQDIEDIPEDGMEKLNETANGTHTSFPNIMDPISGNFK